MKATKLCPSGKVHSHCKLCRPDLAAAARSASFLPSALIRSQEAASCYWWGAGKERPLCCAEELCEKKYYARSRCFSHYMSWRRKFLPSTKTCSIDNCNKKHCARSWCEDHYQRWAQYGDPIAPPRKKGRPKWLGGICGVEGCEKEHFCNGYCQLHWGRVKKNGAPGQVAPLCTDKYRTGCFVEGCEEPHCAKGFCKSHYDTLITSPQRRALKRGSKSRLKPKQWLAKLKEYDYRCAYCGAQDEDIQQDHIMPLSKGGHHTIANVIPACGFCNRRKHNYVNRYLPMRAEVIRACFSSPVLRVARV